MITVFTPTYNRAKTLPHLFKSLLEQTDKRFEWLVIDDGSEDNTGELVNDFLGKADFVIRYIKQENKGLSQTLNRGVDLAEGDIFFRVDSDDFITPDAIELIYSNWHLVEADDKLCGLVFIKESLNPDQRVYCPFTDNIRTNFFDYYNLYGGKGDMAEVIRTDIFRLYKLPKFGDEKFCPEGVVWNRMASHYDVIYIPKPIYKFEYIKDGFTLNVHQNLRRNAIGASTFYAENFDHDLKLFFYLKNAILFWRYALSNRRGWKSNFHSIPLPATIVGLPIGGLLNIYDRFRL
ncbi:MAG: glycosyltransferase family 2 protein [Paludibacteraceae bacterium]|nr:glycosyltransferase family 2 protein [Paludibacteraceae bacterium]MBP5481105.1 glycosyltransferase family 2 protein [Paludibacteraceae bacterium]